MLFSCIYIEKFLSYRRRAFILDKIIIFISFNVIDFAPILNMDHRQQCRLLIDVFHFGQWSGDLAGAEEVAEDFLTWGKSNDWSK